MPPKVWDAYFEVLIEMEIEEIGGRLSAMRCQESPASREAKILPVLVPK